jgi:hypothetical protein
MHEYFTLQLADQRREQLASEPRADRRRWFRRRPTAAAPALRLVSPPPRVSRAGAGHDRRVA